VSLHRGERRVAYLIANGHTNKSSEIAWNIHQHRRTQSRSIYSKLVCSLAFTRNILRELGENR